jgi:hypothetical protein
MQTCSPARRASGGPCQPHLLPWAAPRPLFCR